MSSFLGIPPPAVWDVQTSGGISVRIHKTSKQKLGVVEAISNQWSRTRGVAELFTMLSSAASLACEVVPASLRSWTLHLASTFAQGRNILSVPYCFTTAKKACSSAQSRWSRLRNCIEAAAVGGQAAIQFAAPNAFWLKNVGGLASLGKTIVSTFDSVDGWKRSREYTLLLKQAQGNPAISEEVRDVLAFKVREFALKALKFFLAAFLGLLAAPVFLFGAVLPHSLVVGSSLMSFVSSAIGFAVDHANETSVWSAEIVSK